MVEHYQRPIVVGAPHADRLLEQPNALLDPQPHSPFFGKPTGLRAGDQHRRLLQYRRPLLVAAQDYVPECPKKRLVKGHLDWGHNAFARDRETLCLVSSAHTSRTSRTSR